MNVYEIVTNKIIEELEKGIIPWHKPWTGCRNGAISHITGKPYSFINQMLLSEPGEYVTFNQARKEGGKIKKGAKGQMVVFFKPFETEKELSNGETKIVFFPVLKYFTVFHISDCEGIESKFDIEDTKFNDILSAEKIANDYSQRENMKINYVAGDSACYRPALDEVILPLKDQFLNETEFYSTLFHELTHSTGHEKRLNRFTDIDQFNRHSESYSKEELVAEIGAASSLSKLGLESEATLKNSAAYIQSWIKALKNDKKMIVSASSRAEKAMKLIFNEILEEE